MADWALWLGIFGSIASLVALAHTVWTARSVGRLRRQIAARLEIGVLVSELEESLSGLSEAAASLPGEEQRRRIGALLVAARARLEYISREAPQLVRRPAKVFGSAARRWDDRELGDQDRRDRAWACYNAPLEVVEALKLWNKDLQRGVDDG